MKKYDVVVIGAGLSGLTTAICAARDGKSVIVFEKNPEKDSSFPRSIHMVLCDFDKLEAFLGFTVRDNFLSVSEMGVYFDSVSFLAKGAPMFNVERGNTEQSIDVFLRKKAVESGVRIIYNNSVDDVESCVKYLKIPDMKNIVLAVGVFADVKEDLKMYEGFDVVVGEFSSNHLYVNGFVGDYAYKQYGYISSANGIAVPMLLSRKKLAKNDWDLFKKALVKSGVCNTTIKKTFSGYMRFRKRPQLFGSNGCINCGACAGAIDPFLGFGIIYSMLSGKIAAIALTDKGKAKKHFNRLIVRKFYMSLILQRLYYNLPFSEKVFEIYCHFFNPLNLVKFVNPNTKKWIK